MSRLAQSVAAIAAERIRSKFAQHDEKQLVRARGFLPGEVPALVSDLRSDQAFAAEVMVIAKEAWGEIPQQCVLPADSSATHFRNAKGSFVFVEVDEFADLSGMSSAYLVTDGNLLGQEHLDRDTAMRCLSHVWGLVSQKAATPMSVEQSVDEVIAAYKGVETTVGLRPWLQFLIAVAERLDSTPVVDARTARSAIAEALPLLGMFPDQVLGGMDGTIPRLRRLRENLLASMDRTATGKEFDREQLAASLPSVTFVGSDGTELSPAAQAAVRETIQRYLEPHHRTTTAGIELHHWRQLFESRAKRRGLGAKIREVFESVGGDALEQFTDLEVDDALDRRDASSAQELIDSELDDGEPLYRLLPDGLQRRVEKLANPKAPATDHPLRDLVGILRDVASEEEGEYTAFLEARVRHGDAAKDEYSKALFAFLFGPTLVSVRDRSDGKLSIQESLLDASPLGEWLSHLADPPEEDEEPDGLEWEPLVLQVRLTEDADPIGILEWDPRQHSGLIALARIVYAEEVSGWHVPSTEFTSWVEESIDSVDLPGATETPTSDLVLDWLELRRNFLRLTQGRGVVTELLRDYWSSWAVLLDRAHTEFVPAGSPDPTIAEFLRVDVYTGPDGSKVLLGTHPIRLRWVAEDLDRSADLLVDALRGSLRLNSYNEDFFFDRLGQSSAHEQPAVLCDASSVMVAVRESDWHEHFRQIRTRERLVTDWLGATDDSSLDEIAKVLGQYVDAFPYKADGLHVLFVVRRGGARIVHRVLDRFQRQTGILGRRASTRLAIYVVCPPADFDSVARVVEGLDASRRAEADLPSTRLVLYPWENLQSYPDLEDLSDQVDLAVVPNLFAAQTRCQEASCNMDDMKGEFRPWIDRSTTRDKVDSGASSASISLRLLPEARDEVLSKWSTINVRHFRGSKVVAESAGQDIDYMTLSVAVSEAGPFFEDLHSKAHWVVTLDPFVGRRQIESFEHRPEVITVKPGLGKGGGYTMIVSSQVGREFIQGRLARRLELQLGDRIRDASERVAGQIYNRARNLSPGLLLRATGLGRTAQEAVGLVTSQSLADQFAKPATGGTSFVSWIALDERPDWFGGGRLGRADLLRVSGVEVDGELVLSLLVVEAKLRDESGLTKAVHQLDDSCRMLREALTPLSEDYFNDAEFWWSSFLGAIEESARDTDIQSSVTFRAFLNGTPRSSLPPEWSARLREGKFTLGPVEGVACTFAEAGAQKYDLVPGSDHRWIQVTPDEMATVLRDLDGVGDVGSLGEDPPTVPAASTVEPAGGETATGQDDGGQPRQPKVAVDARMPRGESEGQLLVRYQQVLDIFAEHQVEVVRDHDAPVQEGPGFFVFRVRPGKGVSPKRVEAQVDNLKLKMQLPADLNPRAYVDLGSVVFEVPKQPEERYYVSADDLWSRVNPWPNDRLWVALGEDIGGSPVAVDFSSNETPHLLIGGITGSGKSVALETLIVGLLRHYRPDQLRISAVDPKSTELGFLEDHPHLEGDIGWDAEDAKNLLSSAVEDMQSRYAKMKARKVRKLAEYNAIEGIERLPWRLVILDEFADLTSDRDDKREIEHSLQRLAQKARASGIHVIVATQKPSAEVLSTKVRSNLGAQLALRVKNATDSRIIMDASGAEALAGGGDAFLKTSGGIVVRFQCAKV